MSLVDMLVLAGLVAIGVGFAAWLIWAGIVDARAQPFDVVFYDGIEPTPVAKTKTDDE